MDTWVMFYVWTVRGAWRYQEQVGGADPHQEKCHSLARNNLASLAENTSKLSLSSLAYPP